MTFVLDPRLANDTIFVKSLAVCDLLIMNDSRYPWAILAPRIEGARELHDLNHAELADLLPEVMAISRAIGQLPGVTKVNIGALGNIVSQLHVHVVGRCEGDPAWPGPVWGHSPRVSYLDGQIDDLLAQLMKTELS